MSNGAAIVRAATVASSATLAFHPLDSATSDWERLVATSPEARLYHRPYWIDALQRSYGFPIFVASFRAGADLLASCVLARSLTPWNQRLVALPFSDRCEPLAVDDGALDALLVALARSCSTIPCELRGIAGPLPWQTNNSFINWDLDLSVTTRRLEQKLSANFRRNLVSASRLGVTIERGRTVRDLQRFIALNAVSRRRL